MVKCLAQEDGHNIYLAGLEQTLTQPLYKAWCEECTYVSLFNTRLVLSIFEDIVYPYCKMTNKEEINLTCMTPPDGMVSQMGKIFIRDILIKF